MADFTFRIRFRLSPRDRLPMEETTWTYQFQDFPEPLLLSSHDKKTPIKETRDLVIRNGGWPTHEDALRAGERCRDAVMVALVRMWGGADFGRRRPKERFFVLGGPEALSGEFGGRVLRDEYGLMVYESHPVPKFFYTETLPCYCIKAPGEFEELLSLALTAPPPLSDRERLAFDFYYASTFETTPEAQFLSRVMAIEVLLVPKPRPEESREHVESLIALTKESKQLSHSERDSIRNSLKWLLDESIGQAGRRLAREQLGDRKYMDMSAPDFFTYCYNLRSKLVHGIVPAPSTHEIEEAAVPLWLFVSDLLTGSLPCNAA